MSEENPRMRTALRNYLPAVVCAIIPILCYFLIRPYAEINNSDDWAYIWDARKVALTGHISYSGWESPMLGWQLFYGAFFIKLFGFSFTAIRLTTLIEAVVVAFLLQRSFVRAGLNSRNAVLAAMIFILSPLYLKLTYTYHTDVAGVLCIVVCLYMCLRACQAKSEHSAIVWISLAALVNAVGGTARQISWLGVLVMVPCTLWLLRKSRPVVVAGWISWIVGVVIVAAAMHWHARQPYVLPELLIPAKIHWSDLRFLCGSGAGCIGVLALYALPLLLMFSGPFRLRNRRVTIVFGALLCLIVSGTALIYAGVLRVRLAPFLPNDALDSEIDRLDAIAAQVFHLSVAHDGLRALLTGAAALGILCLGVCVFAGGHGPAPSGKTANPIAWLDLGILLGPFSAASIAILALNKMTNGYLYDRYLLPLFAILLLVLARYYQESVKANLPWACALLILFFGGFNIAATHDEFAQFRGYSSAVEEIESSGVSATDILGPFQFQGWAQLEKAGYINDPRIRIPQGAYVPQPARANPVGCAAGPQVPAIKPVYVVSINPGQCGGQVAFPPVAYYTWIAPRTNWIYALKLPRAIPG